MSGGPEDCYKYMRETYGDNYVEKVIKGDYELADYESYAKELVEKHWSYIKKLLETHNEDKRNIEIIGFHYKSSGIHFFKHGVEYMEEDKCIK